MARLSILIPWRGTADSMESSVASILANRPPNCEVLVVHRGPYDDPWEIRREVLLVEHDEDASLADLLNRGLEVASGEVVHVLGCGVEVTEGWTRAAWKHFDDPEVGAVTPLIVAEDDPQTVLDAGVHYRKSGARRGVRGRLRRFQKPWRADGPSLQAGFYRTQMVRQLGGFAADVGSWIDADLAAAIAATGHRNVCEPDCVLRSAPIQAPAASVMEQQRLFWRQAPGQGWFGSLTCNAGRSLLDAALHLGRGAMRRLASRLAAIAPLNLLREQHRRLRATGPQSTPDKTPQTMPFRPAPVRGRSESDRPAPNRRAA